MKKYIDAEKLIKALEESQQNIDEISAKHGGKNSFRMGRQAELDSFRRIITSLQLEQPEVDLEKIEKASYDVFPVKKKLGAEIKYPNREDENFSKREIWKDGVIWAFYELGLNARKEKSHE